MRNNLILFDIDETLIENCQFTDSSYEIKNLINNFPVDIGICTHRPWVDAEDVYSFYNMNGAIICEGGSIFKSYRDANEVFVAGEGIDIKCHVRSLLSSNFSDFNFSDNKIDLDFNALYLNEKRQNSVSIYFGNHAWLCIESIVSLLEENSYKIYLDNDKKKISVFYKRISKFGTIKEFLSDIYDNIYFVTDIESLEGRSEIYNLVLCSVGQDIEFNKYCEFVSKKKFSSGVSSVINYIKKRIEEE